MTTLYHPTVEAVLSRLYAEARENDRQLEVERKAAVEAAGHLDEETLASIRNRTFMAVAPEVGRLFYLLVRTYRPSRLVEFGTSFGLSAIHLAAALRDNGSGHLITTEQSPEKAARAAQHFEQAGLSDLIEVRRGDAFETLRGVEKIDMLFLDGWKPLYLPLLRQLEPVLSPRCLVVADDILSHAAILAPYLDYVRDKANGYVSCEIPLDDGVELSFR
ncbi:MAG TPA: class I SAM-dependent methyltransferase [Acidobacteriaceae bacterium]